MPEAPRKEPCPECGKLVSVRADVCPFCDADLYEDDDDELRRRVTKRPGEVEATDFLIPTNVSGWSIASCYLGLIGFCLPLIGLVFALPALIFGIIALRRRKRGAASYGSVTSDIRAVIGLILGGLGTIIWSVLIVVIIIGNMKK